jgi:hypothetical protein
MFFYDVCYLYSTVSGVIDPSTWGGGCARKGIGKTTQNDVLDGTDELPVVGLGGAHACALMVGSP